METPIVSTTPTPETPASPPVPPVHDSTAHFLAWALTLGFLGVVAVLLFYDTPERGRDILNILLGVLGSNLNTIIGYYFGSSALGDTIRLRSNVRRSQVLQLPEHAEHQEGSVSVVGSQSGP